MTHSPIALFVYYRPNHTCKTLESLMTNDEFSDSPLYVFCDGAKRKKDIPLVQATRELIRSYELDNATIIERKENMGLANSIITGVTELCDRYGRVIVVEDDLVVSPYFLEYMNTALDRYKNETSVMQISGYMFPVEFEMKNDAVFLTFTSSWGWATWQRAWKRFDTTMSGYKILKDDPSLRNRFDLGGCYNYFNMLESQVYGKIDSWAIQWYLSIFMLSGLTLYPARTLVQNIGFDGSGTHCGRSGISDNLDYEYRVLKYPPVEVSEMTPRMYSHLARSKNKINIIHQLINKILRVINA